MKTETESMKMYVCAKKLKLKIEKCVLAFMCVWICVIMKKPKLKVEKCVCVCAHVCGCVSQYSGKAG